MTDGVVGERDGARSLINRLGPIAYWLWLVAGLINLSVALLVFAGYMINSRLLEAVIFLSLFLYIWVPFCLAIATVLSLILLSHRLHWRALMLVGATLMYFLSLVLMSADFPIREDVLDLTSGIVFFSIAAWELLSRGFQGPETS